MLVKIFSNGREYLLVLHVETFEEFMLKTKQMLKLESTRNISVEFSGCGVNEDVFKEVLLSLGGKKELIVFNIVINAQPTIDETESCSTDTEFSQLEYLSSQFQNENTPQNEAGASSQTVGDNNPSANQVLYEILDVQSSNGVVPSPQIIDKRLVVNSEIISINFERIFEVGKLMGLIRSGLSLEPKHRFYVAKACIKKVLESLGYDYM